MKDTGLVLPMQAPFGSVLIMKEECFTTAIGKVRVADGSMIIVGMAITTGAIGTAMKVTTNA